MAYVSQKSRDAMPTFQEVQIAKNATMMPTDRNIQIPKKTSNVIYMNRKVLDVCIHKVSEIERVTFQFEKQIGELTQAVIDELQEPYNLQQNHRDDDPMIPINIHPSYAAFRNVEQMVEHIGVQATVEAFIEGHTYALSKKAEKTEANSWDSSLCKKAKRIEANFWNA